MFVSARVKKNFITHKMMVPRDDISLHNFERKADVWVSVYVRERRS